MSNNIHYSIDTVIHSTKQYKHSIYMIYYIDRLIELSGLVSMISNTYYVYTSHNLKYYDVLYELYYIGHTI